MFFEAHINEYNFRYDGGDVIEVSKVGDRYRTIIREIPVSNIDSEKKFHSEISFWFMENGNTLDD